MKIFTNLLRYTLNKLLLSINYSAHLILSKSFTALNARNVSRDNIWDSINLNKFDILPKGMYDCLPKDTCVFGPSDQFLLIKKNRYQVKLLPGQLPSSELGVGWITESNTPEAYDLLWGDKNNLQQFRNECHGIRDVLTSEIISMVTTQLSRSSNIVDIGCGAGDLLLQALHVNTNIIPHGLDFSPKSIELARTRFKNGHDFITYTIDESLPYDSASFDMVFCTDVLEHLEQPKLIIDELYRIAKPYGSVIIVVPDGRYDQFLGHLWFWSPSSFKELLSDYDPRVSILPQSRELFAIIDVHPSS
ncbi:class I SAM-dependent methyltransferase [Synechococcus sp. Cu2B8-bc1011]|uniref:class I SAM-dependent methyltransferase n=1 Tax=Synechococcus sp. Cu2B8-bc1011 TaxID=3093725 RepID=UPI0039B0C811